MQPANPLVVGGKVLPSPPEPSKVRSASLHSNVEFAIECDQAQMRPGASSAARAPLSLFSYTSSRPRVSSRTDYPSPLRGDPPAPRPSTSFTPAARPPSRPSRGLGSSRWAPLRSSSFTCKRREKRRGWDSNPRDGSTPPTRFPVALLRPTRTPLRGFCPVSLPDRLYGATGLY